MLAKRDWSGVLFAAIVATAALLIPEQAQACPAGQQIIGMTQGGPAIAPHPICGGGAQPHGGAGGQQPESLPRYVHNVNNSGAIVLWFSADGKPGYSFSRWGEDKQKETEADAVAICKEAGGVDCRPSLWCLNCHITVARQSNGALRAAYGVTRKKAERALAEACRTDRVECETIETREFEPFGVTTNYR